MNIPHINPERKPEVFKENAQEKGKAPSLFSDLNADSMSTKKLLALTGGVLSIALLAIFSIDAFVLSPKDTANNLDLSKNETKNTPTKTEEVKGAQEYTSPEITTNEPANTSAQLPKKPVATKAPTATQTPTNKPEPTAAPTAAPTQVPTSKPEPTVEPTAIPVTPETSPIPTI